MDGRGRGYDEDADTGEGICNTSYVTLLASQSAQEKVFALVSAVSFLGNTTSARLVSLRFCSKRHKMDEPEHTAGGHRLTGRAVLVRVTYRARGEIHLKHLLDVQDVHLFPDLAIYSLLFVECGMVSDRTVTNRGITTECPFIGGLAIRVSRRRE